MLIIINAEIDFSQKTECFKIGLTIKSIDEDKERIVQIKHSYDKIYSDIDDYNIIVGLFKASDTDMERKETILSWIKEQVDSCRKIGFDIVAGNEGPGDDDGIFFPVTMGMFCSF